MFDIKTELKEWRVNFENSEQFSPNDLEEMENHLIDGIDELKNQNLSEEEAFLITVHRLGKPEILEREFKKTHPNRVWQNRIIWMLTGFLLILSLKTFIGLVSKLIVFGSSFFTTNFSVLYFIELTISGSILFLICWLVFKLFFSKNRSVEKFVPTRLTPIHYIIIAIFVSIGQILPEYLRYWMANIHHANYWEIWSEYGGYLSEISITNSLINFSFPLVLVFILVTLNHTFKRVNG